MNASEQHTWTALYRACFGRGIPDADVEMWESIILEANPTRKAVHDAIKSLAELWDGYSAPSAIQIKREIVAIRQRNAKPDDEPRCRYCDGTGIIDRCGHIASVGVGAWWCVCRDANGAGAGIIAKLKVIGQDGHEERRVAYAREYMVPAMASAASTGDHDA